MTAGRSASPMVPRSMCATTERSLSPARVRRRSPTCSTCRANLRRVGSRVRREVAVGERAEKGDDVVDLGGIESGRFAGPAIEGGIHIDIGLRGGRHVVVFVRAAIGFARKPALRMGLALDIETNRVSQ